ncbi:MAG: tRNA (cytidine(34)-2'-O)-methyltransferase, partial [Alphaproteobacteria bacterium MarineAlpha8_Bin1]
TGNIVRLCKNTGSKLHLIKPLGFDISEKSVKRAGMDYFEFENILIYENFEEFIISREERNFFLITKFGKISYEKAKYNFGDYFIFGSEDDGLSDEILKRLKNSPKVFIPMMPTNRSLNLSNAVSICVYEAWRQNKFNILK